MNEVVVPARLKAVPPQRGDLPSEQLVQAAEAVAAQARGNAANLDTDDAFPSAEIAALAECGLLAAPLPVAEGGHGLGLSSQAAALTARVLATIGGGSLPLGRVYEGHVNAVKLICTFGHARQVAHFAALVRDGAMLAVWNTEARDGVRLVGSGAARHLEGRKIFASGAGHIVHPLITARDERGDLLMVIPTVADSARGDGSAWQPHGMRASASGALDFTGLPIDDMQVIGGPDDFHAQPMFSAGAWRFAAVQAGGIATLFDMARAHLVETGRADDPHQRARMGTAAIAAESALLWVARAARMADDDTLDADARVAFVNCARLAVERAGLDVLELAQRSVGLQGFMRSHPMEQQSRDLATYLRQPNPDKALGDAAGFGLASPAPLLRLWPWL